MQIDHLSLFRFLMKRVFSAETTIFVHFQPVRIIFLVFHCVVITLFALCASQGNLYPHIGTSCITDLFLASLEKSD